MKIRAKMLNLLAGTGLSQTESAQVLQIYESSADGQAMTGRMDEDDSGHPPYLISAIWIAVQGAAVRWIDANCPSHAARAGFVTGIF